MRAFFIPSSIMRLTRFGLASYALLIVARSLARMMQPPVQMRAHSPRSTSQSWSLAAVRMMLRPCVVGMGGSWGWGGVRSGRVASGRMGRG